MSSNIMSDQPLTFGIELEMAIAYWRGGDIPNPTKTRHLRFDPTEEDYSDYEAQQAALRIDPGLRRDNYHKSATINCKKTIMKLLREAGLPISTKIKGEEDPGDYSVWEVVEDVSIGEPRIENPYNWFQIEMRSPAYVLNPENLVAVEKVCNLLKQNFLIDTSNGCGFHVHVGREERGFDDQHIRNLFSFVWAFEPQLNSILGNNRFDNVFCLSARESSRYSRKYLEKYGCRPSPLAGVLHFQEDKDLDWTAVQANGYKETDLKYNAVNVKGLVEGARGSDEAKPTIEWRQHEGTVDAQKVTNWVTTVVGIVNFVCHAPRQDLHSLLSMAANEHWEKLGDGRDEKREREKGPIVAESLFKACDLFTWMGLKSADFYRNNTYEIEKRTRAKPYFPWISWDYMTDGALSEEERQTMRVRRRLFECLRKMKLDEKSAIKFDSQDRFWPPHTDQKEDMDRETDESTPGRDSPPSEPSESSGGDFEESSGHDPSSDESGDLDENVRSERKASEKMIRQVEREAKKATEREAKRKQAEDEEEFEDVFEEVFRPTPGNKDEEATA